MTDLGRSIPTSEEEENLVFAWRELGERCRPGGLIYAPAAVVLVALTPELARYSWLLPLTVVLFSAISWWRYAASKALSLRADAPAKWNFDLSAVVAAFSTGSLAALIILVNEGGQQWLAVAVCAVIVVAGTTTMVPDFRGYVRFWAGVALPCLAAFSFESMSEGLAAGITVTTLSVLGFIFAWANHRTYWSLLVRNRQQVKELSSAHERLEMVLYGSNLGGFDWLLSQNVVYFDEKLAEILGQPKEKYQPFRGSLEELVWPEDLPDLRERLRGALRQPGHGYLEIDARFVAADGGSRWFTFRGKVTERDAEGRARRITGTYEHTTAQKVAEAELTEMREQIEQSEKLKTLGILAGGVAHDVNNLLATILGNLELVESGVEEGSEEYESLCHARRAARDVAHLADQLLAYAGKGKFSLEFISLNTLVTEMTQLLRVTVGRDLELDLDLSPTLPLIKGDAGQIQQVVLNLLTNAAESMDQKEHRTVRLRTSSFLCSAESSVGVALAPAHYVSLEVEDEGCGMEEETMRKIFDPFYTTKFTGRGLGLASVLGIVRSHGGSIQVSSKVGEGTRFQVLLPAAEGSLAGDESAAAAAPAPAIPALPPPATSATVLVVDDEPGIRRLTERLLRRAGHKVFFAEDGVQALEKLEQHEGEINLVLLDLTMPRMNGYETIVEIRKRWPSLPVILSSGYSADEVMQQAQAEVQGFVKKPFTPEQLFQEMAKAGF